MWGSKTRVRAALIAVSALVFMTVGATAALAEPGPSITAESTGCETVTIHYQLVAYDSQPTQAAVYPAFNAQGTVNGVVKNGNGYGNAQIVFTNVAPGLANWSGSMWWDWPLNKGQDQYFNQGTVQVEPCPVTTTTTTQPTDTPTTSTTIAQVETDLPDGAGPGFGLTAALAAIGVSLLGGAALIAARREN